MLGYLLSEGEVCERSLADLYWVTLGGTKTVMYGCESWTIKKTDAEAEAPILWLPDVRS